MEAWSDQYVGLPFKWNGYERDGIGCYGLVALVMREQFGVEMPRHDDVADLLASGSDADVPSVPGWREKPMRDAKAGDILHMNGVHNGQIQPMHIGVFVGSMRVLHIEKDVGSCIIDISNRRHAWRAIGAYEHV